jgi:DNA polymerase V
VFALVDCNSFFASCERLFRPDLQNRPVVVRADQFAAMPTSEVRALLTIGGERVQKELQGVSCLPFESDSEPRQSICTSRSFGEMVSDLSELESAVAFYATACARKLRSEGGAAGALTLFLRTNRYKFDEPQYHVEERVHFEVATQLDQEIVATALQLLRKLYKPGFLYKKAGVILTEITPLGGEQTNLFDSVDRQKQAASTKAFDQIVDRYGTGAIRRATEERGVHWRPRNAFTSPRYTTEWDEIPLFKI